MNQAEARATANGAVEYYAGLTPNMKRLVGNEFPDALSLAYRVSSGELAKPKGPEAEALNYFFELMAEVDSTITRHFQRGVNSRQLLNLAIGNVR